MAKRVIWTKEALSDRIQILDYWYQRFGRKDYSFKLDEMFREIILLISQYPSLGRKLDDREERYFVKDHYQIFYLVENESVTILHIWDSRRNPENLHL